MKRYWLAILLIAVVVIWGAAFAQNRLLNVSRFPLHKPYFEVAVVVCLDAEAAQQLVAMTSAGRDAEAETRYRTYGREGRCGGLQGVHVTYTKQVQRIDARGTVYAVYEGKIGEMTVYVPMEGYLHDGVDA